MINIENIDDNECFKWCLVRYLQPADHNTSRILKADNDFARQLDFKDIKFSFKVRNIHKIVRKNSIGISVFGYERKDEERNMLIYYQYKKKERDKIFLSKILIRSCASWKKVFFIMFVYSLLVQKKY